MGPCTEWITLAEIQDEPDASGLDPPLLQRAIADASDILYRLSGRQFPGVCTDTVRPCRRRVAWSEFPYDWRWVSSWGVCGCAGTVDQCGCGSVPQVTLGAYPVREISEVRVDGEVVHASRYRVDDYRWLVRTDGDGWPSCQNLLGDPLTETGTFQVAFAWGQAPPDSGVDACRMLAIEIAKAMSGNPCALPQRVQNLSVQGASYALLDPMVFLDQGRTGMYFVDLFLAAVNPKGLRRRPSVISPDVPKPVRRVNTLPGS